MEILHPRQSLDRFWPPWSCSRDMGSLPVRWFCLVAVVVKHYDHEGETLCPSTWDVQNVPIVRISWHRDFVTCVDLPSSKWNLSWDERSQIVSGPWLLENNSHYTSLWWWTTWSPRPSNHFIYFNINAAVVSEYLYEFLLAFARYFWQRAGMILYSTGFTHSWYQEKMIRCGCR